MDLKEEYKTLRDEVLQLYKEQTYLAFVVGITSIATLFSVSQSGVPVWLAVSVQHLILIGITLKLITNYRRAFLIGSYLKIMHEMNADIEHIPVLDQMAWYYRSRKISQDNKNKKIGLRKWPWSSGTITDALFLLLLGFSGELLFLYYLFVKGVDVFTVVSVVFFAIFCMQVVRLSHVGKEVFEFEYDLWKQLGVKGSQLDELKQNK